MTTTEELYHEACDLARNISDALAAQHRYHIRHYRLSIALDHALARCRRRYVAAYGHRRHPLPIDVRPTEERLW